MVFVGVFFVFVGGFLEVVFAGGFCGWFLRVVFAGGFCGWFLRVLFAGGFCGWFLRVVFVGGFCGCCFSPLNLEPEPPSCATEVHGAARGEHGGGGCVTATFPHQNAYT